MSHACAARGGWRPRFAPGRAARRRAVTLMLGSVPLAATALYGPDLVSDWRVVERVRVPVASEVGETRNAGVDNFLGHVGLTVTAEHAGRSYRRRVAYLIAGPQFGAAAHARLDPTRPGLLSTDLGLAFLRDRTLTLAALWLLLLGPLLAPRGPERVRRSSP